MLQKIKSLPKDKVFFFIAIAAFSFSQSIVDSTFNNFLNESFALTDFQRGFLELPRELPGFLVIFISAILFFLCPRRLAAFAHFLAGIGVLLMGLFSYNFSIMLLWLLILSSGQHIFLPLISSIGMELGKFGNTGRILGQINGLRSFAAVSGSVIIFLGFYFFHFNFSISYIIAATGFFFSAFFIYSMTPDKPMSFKEKFTLKKEYRLFYWLNILYGTRKQIFITFAPWVLVSVFHQKTSVIATLLTVGGVVGIIFQPLLGKSIDKFGERAVLMGEALMLVFVCFLYGFSKSIFPDTVALFIIFICFILDQMLISVSMARATYLKKIAIKPEDVSQTLTMGVSIDHVFSIIIALGSGLIWLTIGYQFVFVLGGLIAIVNLFSSARIRISKVSNKPSAGQH